MRLRTNRRTGEQGNRRRRSPARAASAPGNLLLPVPLRTENREAEEAAARAHPKIAAMGEGKTVVKTIVVPGRMVNYPVK